MSGGVIFSVNKANVQLNLGNMDMKKTSQNQAQANDLADICCVLVHFILTQ